MALEAEEAEEVDSLLQREYHEGDNISDEELQEFIKENGVGYKSRSGVVASNNNDVGSRVNQVSELETQLKTELYYVKQAVLETLNPFTFIACFFVILSMYLSLIGWGPYLGPKVGPWLNAKGLPGGAQWADIHEQYGGHRTLYTTEGEKRDHSKMKDFAENVRVVPDGNELASLKQDLKHMRSNIGVIVDEIHRDEDLFEGQYLKDTYMQQQQKSDKWHGAAEFYNPDPIVMESNLTIGMMVNTHIVHGHGHMRLPKEWFDCLHIGISSWDMVEISREMRKKSKSMEFGDIVEVENILTELGDLQANYRERDEDLKNDIGDLSPQPSEVLPWFALHNRTGFLLEGFSLKYCPSDLSHQGALLKGPGRDPYQLAIDSVARLARRYQLSPGVLILWYGHKWGDELGEKDEYKHMNVLQEIYPVVSGLQTMRFSGVAHRTNAPIPPVNPITRIPTKVTNLS